MSSNNNRRSLLELFDDPVFKEAMVSSGIAIPLGTDSEGNTKFVDLTEIRNLLVAGSVESGKTEFIYSLVSALTASYRPYEVNLILDDSTRVELTSFNGLPHLVKPAIIHPEKMIETLRWLENETSIRQAKLRASEVTDIRTYNQQNKREMQLPYLVTIAYEISDLMIGFREVAESLLCDLSQTAPDVGIYFILATQRPSPEVITENLKDCFPTRACFSVIMPADSRIVLSCEGAEKLGAEGEMYYLNPIMTKPEYIETFSISFDEVDNLVLHLRFSNR